MKPSAALKSLMAKEALHDHSAKPDRTEPSGGDHHRAHPGDRHRPGEPLDCDILAVGGLDDADVPEDALRAWSGETRGNFTLRMFTGGHLFMLTQYAGLISLIRQLLAIG